MLESISSGFQHPGQPFPDIPVKGQEGAVCHAGIIGISGKLCHQRIGGGVASELPGGTDGCNCKRGRRLYLIRDTGSRDTSDYLVCKSGNAIVPGPVNNVCHGFVGKRREKAPYAVHKRGRASGKTCRIAQSGAAVFPFTLPDSVKDIFLRTFTLRRYKYLEGGATYIGVI